MQKIKNWLLNPEREYAVGLDIYHKHKLNTKHDTFFNTESPTDIHKNMLYSKVARIYQKLLANPPKEAKAAQEPIQIKKIESKSSRTKNTKSTPTDTDKKTETLVKKIEPVANLRKNKQHINKLLSLNWPDLNHNEKVIFNNDEKYFLEKKSLMLRNGDIEKEMRSLHAKVKVIDPDPKNDAARKKLMGQLDVLDEEKAKNWALIDAWTEVQNEMPTESETDKAAREALEKEKLIKNNKIYIYRAEKSLPGMETKTAKQKSRKQAKLDEIKRRKQELIDLGHPYKPTDK